MTEKTCSVEVLKQLVESLRGLRVSLPWKGYGSAIFLELGELATVATRREQHEQGQACITVEWDWRIEADNAVLCGSSNSRPEIERGLELLKGSIISKVDVGGQVPELAVQFSSGHRLRSMVMADMDPQWSIRLPSSDWIYVRAGSLLLGDGTQDVPEQEMVELRHAGETASRWGTPQTSSVVGKCVDCCWFVPLDGEGHLLDFGVCTSASSPFDGRAVNRASGCEAFNAR